jgi:Arc/MetJ family transcription regulator
MLTNVAVDDDLLERAKRLGGRRTKRETVNDALVEYIQRRQRMAALKALGTIDFDPKFDHKQSRVKR